jgi:hypothetical protein
VFGEVVCNVFEALGEDCGVYLDRVSVNILSACILLGLSIFRWGSEGIRTLVA